MNIVLGDNEKRKRKEKVCSTDAWTNISKKKENIRVYVYMYIIYYNYRRRLALYSA